METYITAGILLIVLVYIIFNLFRKVEKLEQIINNQNTYISNLSELIEQSDKILSENRLTGAFKSDDEIGIFFSTLEKIQEHLNNFKINS